MDDLNRDVLGNVAYNVTVTIEYTNGNIRTIKHVNGLNKDDVGLLNGEDILSVYSDDDVVDITAIRMSKIRKITIERRKCVHSKLIKLAKDFVENIARVIGR